MYVKKATTLAIKRNIFTQVQVPKYVEEDLKVIKGVFIMTCRKLSNIIYKDIVWKLFYF